MNSPFTELGLIIHLLYIILESREIVLYLTFDIWNMRLANATISQRIPFIPEFRNSNNKSIVADKHKSCDKFGQ